MNREKSLYWVDELLADGENYEDVVHIGIYSQHIWVTCTHDKIDSRGDKETCDGRFTFGNGSTHEICALCGAERYRNRWLRIVDRRLKRRALTLGLKWPPQWGSKSN